MHCQNIRAAIDTSSPGQPFNDAVTYHLADCGNCGDYAAEMSAFQALLGDLPRVQAPNDFDFKLRARLAQVKAAPAPRGGFGFFSDLFHLSFLRGEGVLSFGQAAAIAASVLLAVTLTAVLLRNNPTTSGTGPLVATNTPPAKAADPVATPTTQNPAQPQIAAATSGAGQTAKKPAFVRNTVPGLANAAYAPKAARPAAAMARMPASEVTGVAPAVFVSNGTRAVAVSSVSFGAQLSAASTRGTQRPAAQLVQAF
ncbi:MAG: hypothetical protein ACKV2V_00200 [Blastocatellia bacterium]